MKSDTRRSAHRGLLFPALASGVLLSSPAHAAVLANYLFTGGSLAASGVDPIISATDIANTNVDGFQVSSTTNQLFLRGSLSNSTLTLAVTNNDYVQFTVTPTGANIVSLTSISFDHLGSANNQPAFTSNLSVFAQVGGIPAFSAGNELGTSTVTMPTATNGDPVLLSNDATFTLGPAFQALTSANTVTFRIYGFDDVNGSDQINRLDDIKINGQLVPEPTTALLAALGGLMLFRRRSRV